MARARFSMEFEVLEVCRLPWLMSNDSTHATLSMNVFAFLRCLILSLFSIQIGYRQMIHQLQVESELLERLRGQLVPQRKALLLGDEDEVLLQ